MKKHILIFLLLTASASAQFAMVGAWQSSATFSPADIDSLKGWYVAADLADSLGKSSGDTTYVLRNRARWIRPTVAGCMYQATDAKKPVLQDSLGYWQLNFDGSDDAIRTAIGNYPQPVTIIAVVKIYKPNSGGFLFTWGGGVAAASECMLYAPSTVNVMNAGADGPSAGLLNADSTYALIATYNGASSSLDKNGVVTTGNAGAERHIGTALAERAASGLNQRCAYRAFFVISRELTAPEIAGMKTYITDNYGATYP